MWFLPTNSTKVNKNPKLFALTLLGRDEYHYGRKLLTLSVPHLNNLLFFLLIILIPAIFHGTNCIIFVFCLDNYDTTMDRND